jgi:hypothetical protein
MLEYLRLVGGGSGSESAAVGDTQILLVRVGVVAAMIVVVYLVFRRK